MLRPYNLCTKYLLRQRRDHGWTPPLPTPRADAPEVLGAYFAQRAAEQEAERETERVEEHQPAVRPPDVFCPATPLAPSPEVKQPPSLADLWQDTLVGLRLRLPRDVQGTDLGSLDPETGQLTAFFNPRTQDWEAHFRVEEEGRLLPLTPEGRVTVVILRMNDSERILERQLLIAVGQYP